MFWNGDLDEGWKEKELCLLKGFFFSFVGYLFLWLRTIRILRVKVYEILFIKDVSNLCWKPVNVVSVKSIKGFNRMINGRPKDRFMLMRF